MQLQYDYNCYNLVLMGVVFATVVTFVFFFSYFLKIHQNNYFYFLKFIFN